VVSIRVLGPQIPPLFFQIAIRHECSVQLISFAAISVRDAVLTIRNEMRYEQAML
jgi:hypothetical protein